MIPEKSRREGGHVHERLSYKYSKDALRKEKVWVSATTLHVLLTVHNMPSQAEIARLRYHYV